MAGFVYRGQISGAQDPILENLIIANSETVLVGNAVNVQSGFVQSAAANERVYGICVGIVTNKGIDLDNAKSTDYDGTWTSSSGTYAATSDNQTDKMVRAVVCPDPMALWYNDTSGTLTTAMLKTFFSLTSAYQVDQSTSSATVGEFQLWKLDPDEDGDASKGLFRIVSWQGEAFEPET
jgi:hypothetical protein